MYASQRRDLCISQISLLLNFTDIHVRSEITRREHKLTTGTVKMYLLVHFYLRVCCANTLLCSNTAILGGSDTLRIFSSGTDAAGLNRSDISALLKFAMKSVHGRTLFMMRRRCAVYFKRWLAFAGFIDNRPPNKVFGKPEENQHHRDTGNNGGGHHCAFVGTPFGCK